MKANNVSKPWLFLVLVGLFLGSEFVVQCSVTYDRKAIVINGQRRILFSGSIHYPRSTPEVCSLSHLVYLISSLSLNLFFISSCGFIYLFFFFLVDVGRSDTEG